MKKISCSLFIVLTLAWVSFAETVETEKTNSSSNPPTQEIGAQQPPNSPNLQVLSTNGIINNNTLLSMQKQLEFELQQTQRTLQFIDPNDKQLRDTLETQQAELIKQLEHLAETLRQPQTNSPVGATDPAMTFLPNHLIPAAQPATWTPSSPQQPSRPFPADSVFPSQPMPFAVDGATPTNPNPINILSPADRVPPAGLVIQPMPPQQFAMPPQGMASPLVTASSRDLTELKYTVESLRKEIAELQQTVRDLNTQIQLLNRNFLNSDKK